MSDYEGGTTESSSGASVSVHLSNDELCDFEQVSFSFLTSVFLLEEWDIEPDILFLL